MLSSPDPMADTPFRTMHLSKLPLLLPLLIALPAQAEIAPHPFSQEEIHSAFRAMHYGFTKVYLAEPASTRLEGCADFELKILSNGTTAWFRRSSGVEIDKSLHRKLEHFVVNRFSLLRDRIEHPQMAHINLCFHGDTIDKPAVITEAVDARPASDSAPTSALEERLNEQKAGVSNDEWLQQLMKSEGEAPAGGAASVAAPAASGARPGQPGAIAP